MFKVYEHLYKQYFDDDSYVFGSHIDPNWIVIYKQFDDTVSTPINIITTEQFANTVRYTANKLEIVLVFDKFEPEIAGFICDSKKIAKGVAYYKKPWVPYYKNLNTDHHYTGKYFEWHDSGAKKLECFIRHGAREGIQIEYYENGKIKAKGRMLNDKRDGLWLITKFSSNQVYYLEEHFYKSGILSGPVTIWSDEIKKIKLFEYNMHNNKVHGKYIEYYGNMQPFSKYGFMRRFNDDIKSKGNFANGVKVGHWIEHNNKTYEKGTYLNGIRCGHWIKYHKDGTLCQKSYY